MRCRDGISHSPLESIDPEDVTFAERALFNLLKIHQKEAASLVGVDDRNASGSLISPQSGLIKGD